MREKLTALFDGGVRGVSDHIFWGGYGFVHIRLFHQLSDDSIQGYETQRNGDLGYIMWHRVGGRDRRE